MKLKISSEMADYAKFEIERVKQYPKRKLGLPLTKSEEDTLKHIIFYVQKQTAKGNLNRMGGSMQLFDGSDGDKRRGLATDYSGHIKNVLSLVKKNYVTLFNHRPDFPNVHVELLWPAYYWITELNESVDYIHPTWTHFKGRVCPQCGGKAVPGSKTRGTNYRGSGECLACDWSGSYLSLKEVDNTQRRTTASFKDFMMSEMNK